MISDQTAARLRLIRSAQLRRVRKEAMRRGLPVDRDIKVIRDIAHGSPSQAAEKSRMSESSARRILAQYVEIAEMILAEDRRKAMDFEKEV